MALGSIPPEACIFTSLNKDVPQAIISTFFSVPSSKDSRMGRFRDFSSLYVELHFKLFKMRRPMTLFLNTILALHLKSHSLQQRNVLIVDHHVKKNIIIHLDS